MAVCSFIITSVFHVLDHLGTYAVDTLRMSLVDNCPALHTHLHAGTFWQSLDPGLVTGTHAPSRGNLLTKSGSGLGTCMHTPAGGHVGYVIYYCVNVLGLKRDKRTINWYIWSTWQHSCVHTCSRVRARTHTQRPCTRITLVALTMPSL
jgi:hypothetical protein